MKILVFGGSGLVGSKFIDLYGQDFAIKAPLVTETDILNKSQVLKLAEEFNPDTIINFAAFTNVEAAEGQNGDKNGICYLINAMGAKNVAEVCKEADKKLIHISTEYVFDGTKQKAPYTEEDRPNPINWYGRTKYIGEQFALESGSKAAIIRICMPFSGFYELKSDVARKFLELLRSGTKIKAIEDQKITPTLVDDIANALKIVLDSGVTGLYHVGSKNYTTPLEFARLIAAVFDLDNTLVKPVLLDEYNRNKQAKLLRYSWLDPSKFITEFGGGILHTVEEAVRLFKSQVI